MPQPTALTLVSTSDLMEELTTRNAAMVVVAVTFDDEVETQIVGSALLCSGLLVHAQNELLWRSFQSRES